MRALAIAFLIIAGTGCAALEVAKTEVCAPDGYEFFKKYCPPATIVVEGEVKVIPHEKVEKGLDKTE